MIITIDGCVATGKSTIARKLADDIGFIFFDTGAMYRAVTYGILKNKIDINDLKAVEEYISRFKFDIKVIRGERRYFVDRDDVTAEIRKKEVTAFVSEVSALKSVREKLVDIQRSCAVGINAVFEGRDMGSVVFPDAAIKIFLTGSPEVRAKRRFAELKQKYPDDSKELTIEQCLEEINRRDQYDMTREHSPLRQASDAYVIDTSNLSIDDIVNKILDYKDSLKTKRKET